MFKMVDPAADASSAPLWLRKMKFMPDLFVESVISFRNSTTEVAHPDPQELPYLQS